MLAIRTSGAPERAAPALRAAVRELDPTLALRDLRAMADVLGTGLAARRFSMVLLSVFAAVALALAAVGIYGVLAHAVASRTREFGIRLALGATRHSVLLLVLRQGISWSVLGLALGLLAAVASGRLIAGMLYGIQVTDTWTFAMVAAGLLSIVLIACLIPARRATRADPIAALREE